MSDSTILRSEKYYRNCHSERRAFLQRATALVAGTAAARFLSAQPQQQAGASAPMFNGFKISTVQTTGANINVVSGGQGPPVLLLHGNPQTHVMWHKIAAPLAGEFTVVASDLRGYGDSSKPADGENHFNYSKRAMALDQVEVMSHFGFEKFAVVGHDRGGRVGHRMALDHPDRVTKLVVIDIVPTYKLLHSVNNEVATAFYHWFFLIQPAPFPETLIANNAEFYLKYMMFRDMSRNDVPAWMGQDAFAEYLRCFRDSGTIHANCEDYRAAASIDMKHDEEDLNHKIVCPMLALWGERGAVHRLFDVLDAWRERAVNVRGKHLAGRHFLPEEIPDETLAELRAFLSS
ncbi:MAG TPA: alpha/beta hydrolase [Candidatus Baltobacteraceae bacterium]|nr:alpha/beta hydrolase [Candidatus Baltobacteraceae bacterium]